MAIEVALTQKGYHVRFGETRVENSDHELFLEAHEKYIRHASWFRRGIMEIHLRVEDLSTMKTIFEDPNTVFCNFKYFSNVSSYNEYTSPCQPKLTEQVPSLPKCLTP